VQCAAGVHGFFWPKIFWDFLTKNLDGAVKPVPVLQILNVLFGILSLAWEWPLKPLAGTAIHRSIEIRLLSALSHGHCPGDALVYSIAPPLSWIFDLAALGYKLAIILDGVGATEEKEMDLIATPSGQIRIRRSSYIQQTT
ncbi:hypothetical protein I7I51_00316, partial [Histoplasma capsulatum]